MMLVQYLLHYSKLFNSAMLSSMCTDSLEFSCQKDKLLSAFLSSTEQSLQAALFL